MRLADTVHIRLLNIFASILLAEFLVAAKERNPAMMQHRHTVRKLFYICQRVGAEKHTDTLGFEFF